MTLHAFNRRIEITSTYYVRRRPNRRKAAPPMVGDNAIRGAMLASAFTVLTAVAVLWGVL